MANPATREQLKQYALRTLGKPVIEINVDDDQAEDRIDEALQYFAQYHYDGVERTYLKYKVTQADVDRIKSPSGDTASSITKNSVTSIRNKSYWNFNNLNAKDPVAMGLFTQKDLIDALEKAERRIKKEKKEKEKLQTQKWTNLKIITIDKQIIKC